MYQLYYYRLFQKNEGQENWQQVSTNYGKTVKVLNKATIISSSANNFLYNSKENPFQDPKVLEFVKLYTQSRRIGAYIKNSISQT